MPPSHHCAPRCPVGYTGLSCQRCAARFERVTRGPYLGTCSGCGCHGHSSTCDPVFGHCLVRSGEVTWGWGQGRVPPAPDARCAPQNCQHNTEGPQCEKCKPGFFGDATKGTATACHPCPCPYTESSRRWVPTPGAPLPRAECQCPTVPWPLSPAGSQSPASWTPTVRPPATPAPLATLGDAARGGGSP